MLIYSMSVSVSSTSMANLHPTRAHRGAKEKTMPARRRTGKKAKLDHREKEELLEGYVGPAATPLRAIDGRADDLDYDYAILPASVFASDQERREAWRTHRDELRAMAAQRQRTRPTYGELRYERGLDDLEAVRAIHDFGAEASLSRSEKRRAG